MPTMQTKKLLRSGTNVYCVDQIDEKYVVRKGEVVHSYLDDWSFSGIVHEIYFDSGCNRFGKYFDKVYTKRIHAERLKHELQKLQLKEWEDKAHHANYMYNSMSSEDLPPERLSIVLFKYKSDYEKAIAFIESIKIELANSPFKKEQKS